MEAARPAAWRWGLGSFPIGLRVSVFTGIGGADLLHGLDAALEPELFGAFDPPVVLFDHPFDRDATDERQRAVHCVFR